MSEKPLAELVREAKAAEKEVRDFVESIRGMRPNVALANIRGSIDALAAHAESEGRRAVDRDAAIACAASEKLRTDAAEKHAEEAERKNAAWEADSAKMLGLIAGRDAHIAELEREVERLRADPHAAHCCCHQETDSLECREATDDYLRHSHPFADPHCAALRKEGGE